MQSASIEATPVPTAGAAGTYPPGAAGFPCSGCGALFRALEEIARMDDEIACLSSRNKELEAENLKLFELANLGCDTSGISPSKDWKKDGASAALGSPDVSDAGQEANGKKETPTSVTGYLNGTGGEKRRPGGQLNHPPAFMHVDDAQDGEPVLHYPARCANCPRIGLCIEEGRLRKYHTAHGYDIEVVRIHREHLLYEASDCPNDGLALRDDHPEVIGAQFYDANVQLHVITWHHIFHGSYDRIGLAAKELFGLSLGAGTANAIVQRASAKILASGFMDAIRFFILLFETVLGVDETSARVDGRNAWVHTAVTANVTLLTAHWRRGYEGTIHAGVLQFYVRTLISDCWSAYFKETFKWRHTVCNGHILRELVAAAYFRQQSWAIEMFDLLLEILADKKNAVELEEKSLPQEYLDNARARYRKIVADGFDENPDADKGKTISLLERLRNLEDAVLAFAEDFSVDFTNNASEQSLRNLKVALRVIGQFKTMPGLADYCIIQSFMDTCRKQGLNPFDMLRIVLSGGDIIEAVFGAEKAARIKQMIRLADATASGDASVIEAAVADMNILLTTELRAAACYGRYKVHDDPPPEKKNSSASVPKDKMKAARELNSKLPQSTAPATSVVLPQISTEKPAIKTHRMIRAGPKSA